MLESLKRVVAELMRPSNEQTPYMRGVIAIAHAMIGGALSGAFGWHGTAASCAFFILYWIAKERGDLLRGGAWRDGVEDAIFVAMGPFYGAALWPAIVVMFSAAIMVIAEVKK